MPGKNKDTEDKGTALDKEVAVGTLKPGDIFVYKGERYNLAQRGKKKVKVILLTQAQVGATATTKKTIEYGVSRLDLPAGVQVMKGKPLSLTT